jgi:hypothetical protein
VGSAADVAGRSPTPKVGFFILFQWDEGKQQ